MYRKYLDLILFNEKDNDAIKLQISHSIIFPDQVDVEVVSYAFQWDRQQLSLG